MHPPEKGHARVEQAEGPSRGGHGNRGDLQVDHPAGIDHDRIRYHDLRRSDDEILVGLLGDRSTVADLRDHAFSEIRGSVGHEGDTERS